LLVKSSVRVGVGTRAINVLVTGSGCDSFLTKFCSYSSIPMKSL